MDGQTDEKMIIRYFKPESVIIASTATLVVSWTTSALIIVGGAVGKSYPSVRGSL